MSEKTPLLYVNCPLCGQRTPYTGNPHRPFCSEKCRNIDLVNWDEGTYRIGGEPAPDPTADDASSTTE